MSTTLDSALVADLAGQVSGSVLGSQDAGYDAARTVHNGLIDRKPALIVRCRTTSDVVAALAFPRQAGLEVSIRGGGHNVAGRAVTDGGVRWREPHGGAGRSDEGLIPTPDRKGVMILRLPRTPELDPDALLTIEASAARIW